MRKITIVGMMLVAVLGASSPNRAPEFTELKLTAIPEKAQVVLGEPVILKIKLTNPTQSVITAHRVLAPEKERIQIQLAPPAGIFQQYAGPRWGVIEARPKEVKIVPGETIYAEIMLLFNEVAPSSDQEFLQSYLPLDRQGTYQIRVDFYDIGFNRKITAPIAQVEVAQTSEPEAEIWEAMRSDPEMAYFLESGDARRGIMTLQKLEPLMARHPDSIHTKYFALALGKYSQRRRGIAKAISYFLQASVSPPKSFLRSRAVLGLVESYVLKRDYDKALTLCDTAAKEHTQTDIQEEFSKLCTEVSKAQAEMQSRRK